MHGVRSRVAVACLGLPGNGSQWATTEQVYRLDNPACRCILIVSASSDVVAIGAALLQCRRVSSGRMKLRRQASSLTHLAGHSLSSAWSANKFKLSSLPMNRHSQSRSWENPPSGWRLRGGARRQLAGASHVSTCSLRVGSVCPDHPSTSAALL